MSESFDVIVVGARCAGAPLATMLARRGLRVCVVDKDRFPSDTLSTHGIQPAGVQVLERIGVLDRLLKIAPPMVRGRMVFDDDVGVIDDVIAITGAPILSVRRITLDEILVNAAAEAGADVRTQTAVTGLVMDRGRVAGVITAAGKLRAPLVVGADGTRSAVAKMVAAKEYHRTTNGRVFMWAYYEGDPTSGEGWIGKIADHAYLVTPTDNGLTLVAACPSIDRRDEVRADRERVYEAGLRGWPELHAGVRAARRAGPHDGQHERLLSHVGGARLGARRRCRPLQGPHAGSGDRRCAAPIREAGPPPSNQRSEAAPERPTRPCTSGGAGATRTPGRCTGSPTTWVRPAPRRRCCATPSAASPPTAS